jgi:hypothetical protein
VGAVLTGPARLSSRTRDHLDGRVGKRTFVGGAVTTAWSVVPGSGTGELEGLRGDGGFTLRMGEADATYRLRYHFV